MYFDQINAALVHVRHFWKNIYTFNWSQHKHQKYLYTFKKIV